MNVPSYPGEIIEPFLSAEQIAQRVRELGEEVTRRYAGERLVAIGLLKGAVVFLSDFIRHVQLDIEFHFLLCSSYGESTVPKSVVKLDTLPLPDLTGRRVLVVEDILDTGHTLAEVCRYLESLGCASIDICVLLAKEGYRTGPVPDPDFVGFEIPNLFVVGYGLDYAERYRQLPGIGVLTLETPREGC